MSKEEARKILSEKGEGRFINMEDGDSWVGAFVGDPFVYHQSYSEKTGKYEPYTDEHAKAGIKKDSRFVMQVVLQGPDKQLQNTIKIFEMTKAAYKKADKVDQKYGWDKNLFEFQREGEKTDTKWDALFERAMTEDDRKVIAGLKVLTSVQLGEELAKMRAEASARRGNGGGSSDSSGKTDLNSFKKDSASDDPVTAEQASALGARLKVLDRSIINEFLAKFEVTMVKSLKASQLAAAEAFVSSHEKPKAASTTEIDPFALEQTSAGQANRPLPRTACFVTHGSPSVCANWGVVSK